MTEAISAELLEMLKQSEALRLRGDWENQRLLMKKIVALGVLSGALVLDPPEHLRPERNAITTEALASRLGYERGEDIGSALETSEAEATLLEAYVVWRLHGFAYDTGIEKPGPVAFLRCTNPACGVITAHGRFVHDALSNIEHELFSVEGAALFLGRNELVVGQVFLHEAYLGLREAKKVLPRGRPEFIEMKRDYAENTEKGKFQVRAFRSIGQNIRLVD